MDNPYYEKLVNAAIRYVSFRPRSEKELRDYLMKKPNHEDSEKVIVRMRELGYADDEKFARWWVVQRTHFRAKGNRLIALELTRKGVAKEAIRMALEGRNSLEAARKAIGRKRFDTPQKLYNYLLRRGFDAETIKRV